MAPRIVRDLRGTSPGVRVLLLSTLLLGIGQQLFVVARNPLLAELGWRTDAIPYVQGMGAIAGVLSGIVATVLVPRVPIASAFMACAALQALGFAVQATAAAPIAFFVGAAVAGLAIQLNTAIAPPALHALSRDEERVSVFGAHAMALAAVAGLGAAAIVSIGVFAFGRGVAGHRAVLLAGATFSALSAVAFARMPAGAVPPGRRRRLERARRVAFCVAFQGLAGLASGLTVPFLQLYFKVTFGVSLQGIAHLYASTMLVGTVAYALAPALVARFGLARTIVALQALTLPLFVELARAGSVRLAAAAFVARYTLTATASPLLGAFFQRVSFGRDGEAVAGLGMVTGSVTWALGTLLAGPLVARWNGRFDGAILVTAGLYAGVASVAALSFPRLWRTRPTSAPAA